jgi:hypothetical protein
VGATRELDPSIQEAVYSLCYAAQRVEATELMPVREQLLAKYGKQIDQQAINAGETTNSATLAKVNARVRRVGARGGSAQVRLAVTCVPRGGAQLLNKLMVRPPDPKLVNMYLKEIADAFNVVYVGTSSEELPVRTRARPPVVAVCGGATDGGHGRSQASSVHPADAAPAEFTPLPEVAGAASSGYAPPRGGPPPGGDLGATALPYPAGAAAHPLGPLPYPVGQAPHPQGPPQVDYIPPPPTHTVPPPAAGGGRRDDDDDDGDAMDELSRRLDALKGRAARA